MSARRKGKPQHRKKLETLEATQDTITCGRCRKTFRLSDIVDFIDHKTDPQCRVKDPADPFDDNDLDGSSDDDANNDDAVSSVISSRRTSISAPIAVKGEPIVSKLSPRPLLSSSASQDDVDTTTHPTIKLGSSFDGDRPELVGPQIKSDTTDHVDAEVNTVNSEPSHFVCGTCKSVYSSSWYLLQHVQNIHHLKIYESDPDVRKSPSPPPPLRKLENALVKKILSSALSDVSKPEFDAKCESTETPPSSTQVQHHHSRPPPLSLSSGPQQHRSPTRQSPASAGITPGFPPHSSPFLFHPRQGQSPFNRPSLPHEMTLISPLSGDPFRRMTPFGPTFETPLPGFPFGSTSTFDADTMEDFYSQRLRRLANTSSPTACPTAPSTACPPAPSTTQQTPPPHTTATAPEQPVYTSPRLSSASDIDATKTTTTPTTETDASLTGKLKACEFCGKCFRFQSNLIVHRRSHTGEKPYKCPLCPHACTQASKLKRHMKTHNSAQLSSVCGGSVLLTGLCGDGSENQSDAGSSSGSKMSNEDDGNSEGEGEDEEEEEEDLEELDRDEEFRQMLMKHQRTTLEVKREDEQPTDLSRRTDNESAAPPEPTDLSVSGLVQCTTAQQRSSLLTEMMANSGLGNIQQYKEAFNQALAEREDDDEEDDDDDMEMNGTTDDVEGSDGGNADPEGVKSTPENEVDLTSDTEPDGENNQAAKRIKLEQLAKTELPSHSVPTSMPNHMFPPFVRDPRDLIFPNIWYPPAAINQHEVFNNAFMRAEPFMASAAIAARQLCENGVPTMRLKTGTSPKTTLGLTSPIHASMTSTSPTRVSSNNAAAAAAVALSYRTRRRNDMCEFCGKVFKNCSNLTVHRRSHTGEKPYKCELCNYACAQSSKLTRHMKTHGRLGKDIYRCKFCCMPFSVPSTLEKHMRKCVENHNPSTSPPPQQQLPPLSLSNPVDGRSYSEGHSPLTPPQLPPLPAMTPIETGDTGPRGFLENHSPLTPPHMPALPLTSPSERNCDDGTAQRKSTESHSPLDAPKLLPPLPPLPLSLQSDSRSSNNSITNHSPPTPLELSLTTSTVADGEENLQKFKENHSALSLSLSMPTDSASKDACVRKFLANHQLRRASLDSHHMAYMPSHQPASLLPTAMPAMTNNSAVSALLDVAPRATAMTVVNTEASQ